MFTSMHLVGSYVLYTVVGICVSIILCLVITVFIMFKKYRGLINQYNEKSRECLCKSNKLSMVEYHYRNYKEGKNPFTVLRDVGEVLYNDFKEDTENE